MTNFYIRPLTPEDGTQALVKLYEQLTNRVVSEESVLSTLADNNSYVLGAFTSRNYLCGTATGIVRESSTKGWNMVIEDVVVDTNHRMQGLGIRLVEELLTLAKQEGCSEVSLRNCLISPDTIRLYDVSKQYH